MPDSIVEPRSAQTPPESSPGRSAHRSPRSLQRIATQIEHAVLALLLVIGLVLAAFLWVERDIEQQREERELASLLEANAIAVDRRIGALDLAMVGLAAAVEPDRLEDPAFVDALTAKFQEASHVAQGIAHFLVLDREGRTRLSSVVSRHQLVRSSLADRPSFQAIAADPRPRLVIAPPSVARAGPFAGGPVLHLARPILDGVGDLQGVLVASVALGSDEVLIPRFEPPHGIRVTLFSAGGVNIDQVPRDPTLIGRSFAASPLFTKAMPHASEGRMVVEHALNGDPGPRHVVWRTLAGRDLLVVASKPRDRILAAWTRHAAITASVWLVLSGATLLLTQRLAAALRRRGRLTAQLARRDALMASITDRTDAVLWDRALVGPSEGFVSDSAASLLGHEAGDRPLAMRDWDEAIHPDDRGRRDAALARTPIGGLCQSEYRLRRTDGTALWIRDRARILLQPDGSVRAVGVALDVTAEVETRAALRRSEAELAAAARIVKLGTFRRALGSTVAVWSPSLYDIYGLDPERFVPSMANYLTLLHEDDAKRAMRAMEAIREGGGLGAYQTRIRTPSGAIRHTAVSVEPEHDGAGRLVAYFGIVQDITDIAELRDDLARRTARLETAARLAGLGTFRRLLADNSVEWSPEMHRICGTDPATFQTTEESVFALIHPDDRAPALAVVQQTRERSGTFSYAVRILRPDGTIRHVQVSSETELDADGRPVAMFGVGQDVTHLFAMREDLVRRQAELAAAMRLVGLGTYRRDYRTDTLHWSPEGYVMHGLDPAVFRPTPEAVLGLFLHEDRIAAEIALEGLRRDGQPRLYRARIRRPNGEIRHLQVTAELEHGPDGPVGHFGLVQDVTDLVAIRADLERRSAELDAARQLAGMGIFRRRADGTLVWSSEIYAMFGETPEHFVPTLESVRERTLPEDWQDWLDLPLDGPPPDAPDRREFRVRRPDGQVRHLTSVARVEIDAATGEAAVLGVVQDITLEKETEARLARVDRMTALGQLTGGIAHDVNNLLAVIALNLDLIGEAVATADARTALGIAQHAVDRGAALASRLLAFAQRRPLVRDALDPGSVLRQVARLAAHALPPSVALRVEVRPPHGAIEADGPLLEAALMNLVLNARDAMRPEGGRITLSVAERLLDEETAQARGLGAGAYVAFAVADDGTGMPPDVASRVFEPFFTTKEPGRGTGLGLSTVYGFARQSGGTIEIDTTEGVGTRATLWLPAIPALAEAAPNGEAPPRTPLRFQDVRLLIVEDEATLRGAAARICREAGLEVRTAPDGDAAIAALEAGERFDLVLSDVRMPGRTDGLALARWAEINRPDVRVLLMTGYAGEEPDPEGILRKPFGRDVLLGALADAMARKPLEQTA